MNAHGCHLTLFRIPALAGAVFFSLAACSGAAHAADGVDPAPNGESDRVMRRVVIDQAAHPEAVCNDGSTPVYFHRPGFRADVDKWVLWFKGGGSCDSKEGCESRGPSLTSAQPWMAPRYRELDALGNPDSNDGEAGGILSDDPAINPDFHGWNHVYMVYCSSDQWSGDRGAGEDSFGMHFRGRRIVDAIVADLSRPRAPNTSTLDQATHVLLTGSSAGSSGLLHNVDRLASELAHADVRAVGDAGLMGPPSGSAVALAEWEARNRRQLELWNASVDETCASQDKDRPWLCVRGQHLIETGHISTPIFFHHDLRDPKISPRGRTPEARAERRRLASLVRNLLEPRDGVFVPSEGRHIILNSPRFNLTQIDGVTMAEALATWYFDRPGPTRLLARPRRAP